MSFRPLQFVVFALFAAFSLNAVAESVSPKDDTNVTLQDLIDELKGDGVTVTNPVFTGFNAQAGLFSGYSFLFGSNINDGVVISTGTVANVVDSTNTIDNSTSGFGGGSVDDVDLGNNIYDPVKLTFDVVPEENTLIIDYVFGSEEYNEWVDTVYNDHIRVLVGGSNCALTADGNEVSINTVNNGSNSFLYTDNDPSDLGSPAPFGTQMDGFTAKVSCRFTVTPLVPVNVVIGMSDDGDASFDSWTFFKAQSLRSEPSDEFGDAPDSYQTLISNNGAAHVIVEGVSLGEMPDGDTDGFHEGIDSSGTAADDANDDGVLTYPNLLDTDNTYTITVEGTSINGTGADIIAWIDFDRNGTFESDEASNIATLPDPSYKQNRVLTWNNIGTTGPDIVAGTTFSRVRIVNSGSGISALSVNGSFASGEVEDYTLEISGAGDTNAPVVSIDTPPVVTIANQAIYTVTGNCTAGDDNVFVAIAGAAPANQSVLCSGGGNWSAVFDVSGIADGPDVVSITASQQDTNSNTGNAGPVTADKDVNGPGVSILNAPSITNGLFNVTFEFTEDVSGFTLGEIAIGNGSASNIVATDANTYTADITPDTTGNITINVAANVAQDAANNNNTAAAQVTVIFDNTAPVVSIGSAPIANAGNVANYPVSGNCTAGDGDVTVSITGATPATQDVNCTGGGNWSASFDVSAITDGTNAINVSASQTDSATNIGNDTAQADKESDFPGVDIQGEPVFVNSVLPFAITVEFTEDVIGFIVTEITVVNGTAGSFVVVDGNTYTANITPSGGGNITIDVAAGVTQDGAGNNNTAAIQASILFDAVAPVVSIDSIPVANAANFTSYPVTGNCESGDGNVTVSIAGATPSPQAVVCTTGNWNATFDLTAIADGTNVVTVNASQTDAFLNTGNAAAVQANKDVVIAVPTVDALLTNNTTPTITGTAEANSAVAVMVAGATFNVVTNGGGVWSVNTSSPDSGTFTPNLNGTNSVLAISTDAAGSTLR